jgi:hypothetical protein
MQDTSSASEMRVVISTLDQLRGMLRKRGKITIKEIAEYCT